jgi:hypothetical protein
MGKNESMGDDILRDILTICLWNMVQYDCLDKLHCIRMTLEDETS